MLVDALQRGGGVLPRSLGDLPEVLRGLLGRTLAHPVLSRSEFGEPVRAALRDLHRPQALQRNPLVRSRVMRSSSAGLEELLATAAETLRTDRRGLFEVVDRTFLHPAGPQERVAESLHLSFSTYRRHRDLAVAHIADWMWEREVFGHQMSTG